MDWEKDAGHPWQLILAYRAALLWPTDATAAATMMDEAVMLCAGQGPTVKAIGDFIAEEAADWRGGEKTLSRMAGRLPFNFR